MNKKVDVVIVGSGLGGLSAAAYLASSGQKVLVLERHNIPGGYATSFVRGRYEFEVSLHELSGIGTPEYPGQMYQYLDQIGVARKIEFLQSPTLYRSIYPGIDLTLPSGWDAFLEVICAAFPRQASGIQTLLGIIRQASRDLTALEELNRNKVFSPKSLLKLPIIYPTIFRYNQATWETVLRRHVKDELARAVLSQFWGYLGLPPSQCSFIYFAIALATYIKHGATYVQGRSQALANAFVEAIQERGGEVRMSCGARRILAEGGRVVGVITDHGEEIRSDWIVSNADPLTTCEELIGCDQIPQTFFHKLQSNTIATSTVNVYLGVTRTPRQLGFTDHEIFINRDLDFDRQFLEAEGLAPPHWISMTCYNHVYPEISPPDTSMIVLTSLKFGAPWHNIDPRDYVKTKHHIAEGMLQLAEQVAPDLRKYTEVVEVSTPVTNMRYSGNPGGSIYGYSNHPGRHTIWRLPQRGPLKNLYFVGAWTQPGGGFEPVMASGQLAGEMILAKIGRAKEVAA